MMNDNHSLPHSIKQAVEQYFKDMRGEQPTNMYNMFLVEVEKPFLEMVMAHTAGNQTHAAQMLGINRNTLRKKLQTYGLI